MSIEGQPNAPEIMFTYKNNAPYKMNDTKIFLEKADRIKMTASVSCTKPAVRLDWTGSGKINNNKVTPCGDDSTFTSESELRIDRATKDDTGQISLHVSHPLLMEKYHYQLQVNGRYIIFQSGSMCVKYATLFLLIPSDCLMK